MSVRILQGDCRVSLRALPDASVDCCVTSPPYFGLRSYLPAGHADKGLEIGQEKSPDEFVAALVGVFREVWRVLKPEGTVWLNLGDSFTTGSSTAPRKSDPKASGDVCAELRRAGTPIGLKSKDLIGIPWRVAFALQGDGWWLRQDIIWHKPNPMPESVTDRCTKAHEYIFLLSKSARYYFDQEAIKEPAAGSSLERWAQDVEGQAGSLRVPGKTNGPMKAVGGGCSSWKGSEFHTGETGEHQLGRSQKVRTAGNTSHKGVAEYERSESEEHRTKAGLLKIADVAYPMANKRSVWTVTTKPYRGAHFATFPPDLILPCVLAGCPQGGTVLDPFGGSGTTGEVCEQHGRNSILCELNGDYVPLIEERTAQGGLFCGKIPVTGKL